MILCSTYHDPEARLLDDLEIAAYNVLKYYKKWVIRVTAHTPVTAKNKLRSLGIIIIDFNEIIIPTNSIENDHVLVLKHGLLSALESGVSTMQYADADRVIIATKYYSTDFARMVHDVTQNFSKYEFINVLRSEADLHSHHAPLVHTEAEINRLYSKVFGLTLDIGSTAHAMTVQVAQKIVDSIASFEPLSFPHPLFFIIAKRMGATIGSVETNNILSFETPEQYRNEIEALVGPTKDYAALQKAYIETLGTTGEYSATSIHEWERRFLIQKEYLSILLKYLDICSVDKDKSMQFQADIIASLSKLEIQRKRILARDFSI